MCGKMIGYTILFKNLIETFSFTTKFEESFPVKNNWMHQIQNSKLKSFMFEIIGN